MFAPGAISSLLGDERAQRRGGANPPRHLQPLWIRDRLPSADIGDGALAVDIGQELGRPRTWIKLSCYCTPRQPFLR